MAILGDYWDEGMVNQLGDLLTEYEEILPRTFSKMKGIVCDLVEMKI